MHLIVDLPGGRPRTSSKKKPSVSFKDQVDIKFVDSLAFSKHRDGIWFSKEEMYSFKYQAALTVQRITSANGQYAELHRQETSAFLGLEDYLSKNTSQEIRRRRKAITSAVLSEQRRQYSFGINDPDALEYASRAVSELSSRRARIIAMIHVNK